MYDVLVLGSVISRHRTSAAARRAAERECERQGLVDDGAYSGDDGWPTIRNSKNDLERVDYDAPVGIRPRGVR